MQRATILVVDDSEIVLELCSAALERAGHKVVTHRRAEGTVGIVLREKPDLILLDVNMPRLTGDKLAGALAVANPERNTVVLLHSTLPMNELSVKAREAGAHGCIPKVNDELKFVSAVNDWLRRAHGPTPRSPGAVPSRGALRRGPDSADHGPPTSDTAFPARGPVVLLVDDDIQNLLTLRRELRLSSYELEVTVAPEHALERLLGPCAPDVLVVDLFLSRQTGMDLYRRALQKEPGLGSRFIFMVAQTRISLAAEFLRSVDSEVVSKPVDVERLRSAIVRTAEKHQTFRAR